MRRQTQWALGGVLAGTVLLGATGTLAVFTDTETVTVTAGADSLAVSAEQVGSARSATARSAATDTVLRAGSTGTGPAALWLSVVAGDGEGPCGGLPDLTLALDLPLDGDQPPRPLSLCALVEAPVEVAVLSADRPTAEVPLAVTAGPSGPTEVTFRFTLAQVPTGFSDSTELSMELVGPGTADEEGTDARPSTPPSSAAPPAGPSPAPSTASPSSGPAAAAPPPGTAPSTPVAPAGGVVPEPAGDAPLPEGTAAEATPEPVDG